MAEPAPERHEWAGLPVKCAHCGNLDSRKRMTFLRFGNKPLWQLSWRYFTAFECAHCGHIALFR